MAGSVSGVPSSTVTLPYKKKDRGAGVEVSGFGILGTDGAFPELGGRRVRALRARVRLKTIRKTDTERVLRFISGPPKLEELYARCRTRLFGSLTRAVVFPL